MTNKWAGQKAQRLSILNTYKQLLANYHQQTSDEDGIIYFGNVTLCTMVNAQSYIDEDQGINQKQEGVDELIEGIMTCLDQRCMGDGAQLSENLRHPAGHGGEQLRGGAGEKKFLKFL